MLPRWLNHNGKNIFDILKNLFSIWTFSHTVLSTHLSHNYFFLFCTFNTVIITLKQILKTSRYRFQEHLLFFFFAFPFSPNSPIRYLFTVGLVSFFLCGAAGLRGTFPGYLRPPSLLSFFWTTQHEYHNTQHPWEAIRPGI
jgi:hypothetical protein